LRSFTRARLRSGHRNARSTSAGTAWTHGRGYRALRAANPGRLTRISTAIVELEGDLHGRVLYQVTTRIDSARGKLTNTGRQVYSGTIAGSEPVMLYDDSFIFEANLATGYEHGQVYLVHHLGGPAVRCMLEVSGTGKDGNDNPTFTYRGDCVLASSGAAR
jgi:hypothetical protein